MGTLIYGKCISKMLFPCLYTHNSALAVVIFCPEKGVNPTSEGRWIITGTDGSFSMEKIFTKKAECEMKRLSVSILWFIDSIKNPCHTRNQGKPGHQLKINRGIQGRRDEQTWNIRYPKGMQRSKGLPYNKIRLEFLYPRLNLEMSYLRIKGICPATDIHRISMLLRGHISGGGKIFAQNGRNTGISSSPHSMNI